MKYPLVTILKIEPGLIAGAPTGRPQDFVSFLTLQIAGFVDGNSEVTTLGSICLYKISATAARQQNRSLREICEEYSDSLGSMFHCVFDDHEGPRRSLMITPGWTDLLVFWDLNIEAKNRTSSVVVTALERTITAIGSTDLVVAEMSADLELTVEECKELGFFRIDGTQFAIRDNLKLSKAYFPRTAHTLN